MGVHTHDFVESYTGPVCFGLDRETDEKTLICYLQKFSDDALTRVLIPRLPDGEVTDLFDRISELLRRHLSEEEYHALFLKDPGQGRPPGKGNGL